LGMDRAKREHLKKELARLNERLGKGGLTKEQRERLVKKRDQVLSGLNEVAGNISSVREQIRGLNEEPAGEEEGEDPAVKAAEEQARAAEELKASIDALQKEMAKATALASTEQAIAGREAKRVLADILSDQLGPIIQRGSLAVSIGTVGSS